MSKPKEKLYYECDSCGNKWGKPYGNTIEVIDKCPKCGKVGYLNNK